MTIQVEHTLSKQEARHRIEKLIEQSREEYKSELQNLVVDWNGDSAHIKLQVRGYSTAGSVEVTDNAVDLDFYLPFLLQVFGKKIKSVLHDRVKQSLA
jgi:putative polyhydroxyalkanoate system protein